MHSRVGYFVLCAISELEKLEPCLSSLLSVMDSGGWVDNTQPDMWQHRGNLRLGEDMDHIAGLLVATLETCAAQTFSYSVAGEAAPATLLSFCIAPSPHVVFSSLMRYWFYVFCFVMFGT